MKLTNIRIKSFRTISEEQELNLNSGVTVVGPNNSGKTNILQATRMFFTGYDNSYAYSRERDLTFGESSSRTSLIATFQIEEIDKDIAEGIKSIRKLLELPDSEDNVIHIYLYFSPSSNPVYRFFPNLKRPKDGSLKTQYSRKEKELVTTILNQFVLHYVPSERSLNDLYHELLIPFLRRQAADAIRPHAKAITDVLTETATHLNQSLAASGIDHITARFTFPDGSLEKLIHTFDFALKDPQETSFFQKGMGIQATALLASFLWVTEQESKRNKKVIWLIEEPESFLHPQLYKSCLKLLRELANHALVVTTTHSLGFVPQDPRMIAGTSLQEKHTKIVTYDSYAKATGSIRASLGVGFSDFYNLSSYNLLLEGKTDRLYFQAVLEAIPSDPDYEWTALRSRETAFLDYGGVKYLSGFLRATWEYITTERACVSIFDGDDAGKKEIRDLQGFFGNKDIQFQSNQHYVLVRQGFAIEGLFPDSWIIDMHQEHLSWFENDYTEDASGQLASFQIKSTQKTKVARAFIEKINNSTSLDWASRWIDVCSAADQALQKANDKINKK